jgi:2-methylcitrate dehydratase PrpD
MVLSAPEDPDRPAGAEEVVARAIEELMAWAAGLTLDDIPEAVRRRAALVLCDDLAAMVAARDEPEVVALREQIQASSGAAEATIFGGGRPRADRYSAALANACAADWCELDEGYRKATCHGGLCTLPALLAEAEAGGLTVAEVLRALVLGYEVVTRFARGFVFEGLTLHPHATLAAIGAAAATAAARRLPAERFVGALGAAATMIAPGPFNHAVKGALVRNVWAGAGAWTGMRCVDWSGIGIAGLAASPYHVFVDGLGAEARADELVQGLGAEWAIEDGYHKMHACCQYAHSAVDAIAELTAARPGMAAAGEIESIVVETHWRGLTLDNRAPATTLAAKFSLPHIVAVASQFGHAGADAFTSATLDDPAIGALRARVEMRPFEPERPFPHDRPARVTWVLASGERLEAECLSARGGPDRPFSPAEIMAKVSDITAPVYPAFAPVAEGLIALEPGLMVEPWEAVVERLTGVSAR